MVVAFVFLVPPGAGPLGAGLVERIPAFALAAFSTRIAVQTRQSRWQLLAIVAAGIGCEFARLSLLGGRDFVPAAGADALGALAGLVIGRAVAHQWRRRGAGATLPTKSTRSALKTIRMP